MPKMIDGVPHVLAHSHEAEAIEHEGETWRPLHEPCHWCESRAGYAEAADGNERCKECDGC